MIMKLSSYHGIKTQSPALTKMYTLVKTKDHFYSTLKRSDIYHICLVLFVLMQYRVWVFPEGTRRLMQKKIPEEPLLPFKKGAFNLAVLAQVSMYSSTRQIVKKYVYQKFPSHTKQLCNDTTVVRRKKIHVLYYSCAIG